MTAPNCNMSGVQVMIVCGKSVSGKSTLISNLLGSTGQKSVKKISTYLTKHTNQVDGACTQLFDVNSYDSHTISDLASAVDGKDIALVYCLSMNYGSKVEDSDVDIIKKLSSALTPKIWKSTILALTFANKISTGDGDQRSTVENYAHQFEDALRNGDIKDVRVRSIFNDGGDQTEGVIAIPVGKGPTSVPMCSDWNEKLLNMIKQMTKLQYQAHNPSSTLTKMGIGTGVGAGLGATIGGVVGIATGAIIPGILIGAVCGGGASAVLPLGIKHVKDWLVSTPVDEDQESGTSNKSY